MTTRLPLRVWPGVLIAALVALLRFVVPLFVPDAMLVGIFAGILGLVFVILWWLFFSRAPWIERIGGVLLMIIGMVVTNLVVDASISTGMMGRMFFVYAAPSTLAIAFAIWAATTRHLIGPSRWITMALAIAVGCGRSPATSRQTPRFTLHALMVPPAGVPKISMAAQLPSSSSVT